MTWRQIATLAGIATGLSLLATSGAGAFQYPVQVTAYGALCNGSTDDTAAIVSAISGAGAGGTVQFPAGVCVVSGSSSITLNDVALVGAEVPHFSDGSASNLFEAGTAISIGTSSTAPGAAVPFRLKHSVTIRGINFIYPHEIAAGTVPPPSNPALFSDDGTDEVSNILFENVHAIAPYEFWVQSGGSPPPVYGNIRFVNTDVYATFIVFDWSNVQESVTFDNFISNPSLCSGGFTQCSRALQAWTGDNGIWFHVDGTGGASRTHVGGLQASNLTVTGYKDGVLVDSNGHLDESLFGSTTVFDGVPYVLYVNTNGSITHTVFSGKMEFKGTSLGGTTYSNSAFTLNNPQYPGDNVLDHNTLSLNGFTADGLAGPLISATVTGGDIGAISIVGVVARHYCDGGLATAAALISAPNTAVILVGTQITTSNTICSGLSITASPLVNVNNIVGYYPNN